MSKCKKGATLSLPIFLAVEIRHIPVLCVWLSMETLGVLDIAVSSCSARKPWLNVLKSIKCQAIDVWRHSHSSMRWVMMRSIHVAQVIADHKYDNRLSDHTFVAVGINNSRTHMKRK
jgi:hypothetical protein